MLYSRRDQNPTRHVNHRPTPEASTLATFIIRAALWLLGVLVDTLTFLIRLPFAYKAR